MKTKHKHDNSLPWSVSYNTSWVGFCMRPFWLSDWDCLQSVVFTTKLLCAVKQVRISWVG